MPKPLTGSIRRNDKGDNPKRPDYRGSYTHRDCPSCGAPGGNFWVSSYLNTDQESGEKYLSLGMKEKEVQAIAAAPSQRIGDQDIPF